MIKLYKVPIGSTWIRRKGPVLEERNLLGNWQTIDEAIEFINQAEEREVMSVNETHYTFFNKDGEATHDLTLEGLIEEYNNFNETSRLTHE